MSYNIPSLSTACQIIRMTSEAPQGLSRDEIEKTLSIPRTSAYRILQTLLHEGYVERRNRHYYPGAELLKLGLQMSSADRIRPLVRPILHGLAQVTGFTAHLAVPSGYQALLLEVCDSSQLLRVASRPGSVVALHTSSTGKVFLAHLFRDEIETIEKEVGFQRFTANTRTTRAEVEKDIQSTLKLGYATDDREFNDDVRCLAAPIHDPSGTVIAALGITAPVTLFPKKNISRIGDIVKQHARRCYLTLKA